LSGRHLALLDHILGVDDQHVTPRLVGAERRVGHQQRVLLLLERHANPDEIARQQHAIRILQDAAHRDGAGRLVQRRRDVVERALVRESAIGLQRHLDR
jgi:hypothetical protein